MKKLIQPANNALTAHDTLLESGVDFGAKREVEINARAKFYESHLVGLSHLFALFGVGYDASRKGSRHLSDKDFLTIGTLDKHRSSLVFG